MEHGCWGCNGRHFTSILPSQTILTVSVVEAGGGYIYLPPIFPMPMPPLHFPMPSPCLPACLPMETGQSAFLLGWWAVSLPKVRQLMYFCLPSYNAVHAWATTWRLGAGRPGREPASTTGQPAWAGRLYACTTTTIPAYHQEGCWHRSGVGATIMPAGEVGWNTTPPRLHLPPSALAGRQAACMHFLFLGDCYETF